MKLVYMAGPISGLNFKGCTDWRNLVHADLEHVGIKALSPLRCKDYLAALPSISGHGNEYKGMSVLSDQKGVMARDFFDATRCDVLLVNLLGAKTVSIGTAMEIAWAYQKHTPIVCAMEPEGNPHAHLMLHEAIDFRVPTLADAIEVVKAILL